MVQEPQPQEEFSAGYTLEETSRDDARGRTLVVAADWRVLILLGEWVGGVCALPDRARVRADGGGGVVMDFSGVVSGSFRLGVYPDFAVESVYEDMPSNGFLFCLSGFSLVHRVFGS